MTDELTRKRQRAIGNGLVVKGNLDLSKRPIVRNADGTISTIVSKSFGF